MEQATLDQVQDLLHNEKWMSGRSLKFLSAKSGLQPEQIALGITLVTSILLIGAAKAQLIANAILTVIPLLATFVYVDEKPETNLLAVYWSLFAVTTVLDQTFEKSVPAYYLLKVVIHAMLFLKPYNYADKIAKLVQEKNKVKSEDDNKKEEQQQQQDQRAASTVPKDDKTTANAATPAATPVMTAQSTQPSPQSTTSQLTRKITGEGATFELSGPNPMLTDSHYRIDGDFTSSDELSGIDTKGVGPPHNHNDFITSPTQSITFNGPFDHSVVYHMKIQNNSKHHMAYCIKANCIPRITAFPPSAILKPGQKIDVGVKCEPFKPQETKVEHDRVAFEYVFCDAKETAFSHKLLQNAPYRRRKNMRVAYNP